MTPVERLAFFFYTFFMSSKIVNSDSKNKHKRVSQKTSSSKKRKSYRRKSSRKKVFMERNDFVLISGAAALVLVVLFAFGVIIHSNCEKSDAVKEDISLEKYIELAAKYHQYVILVLTYEEDLPWDENHCPKSWYFHLYRCYHRL